MIDKIHIIDNIIDLNEQEKVKNTILGNDMAQALCLIHWSKKYISMSVRKFTPISKI